MTRLIGLYRSTINSEQGTETVHRQLFWRQFTDKIGDSSPTNSKTVLRQRNTVLWVLMKKINGGFEVKVRFSLKEMDRNVRSYVFAVYLPKIW